MTQTELLQYLKKNPFVLAPMAGITDCGFRSFMRTMGCGVVITELVSAAGLKHASVRTRKLMQIENVYRKSVFCYDKYQMILATGNL